MISMRPPQHVDHLTPPIGTSFFKCEEIVVCVNETLPDDGRQLSWYITMYKYCVGAMPTDPDFQKKGGKVIVILVHHGTLKFPTDLRWTLQIFRVYYDDEAGVIPYLQLPETHSGVATPDGNMQYQIDFEMMMPLFKSDSSEPFLFIARYKEVLVRPPGTTQRGREQLSGLVFTIVNRIGERVSTHQLVRGLTVIKCLDPRKKLRFSKYRYRNEGH
ncbi:hypothetical protein ONZ45_g11785 [Pleurotus djamor]|nr:hypothetical protein ONZ45_g11785 [Pleurotus djamor]